MGFHYILNPPRIYIGRERERFLNKCIYAIYFLYTISISLQTIYILLDLIYFDIEHAFTRNSIQRFSCHI